jgi:hypothetical protein
MPEVSIERYTPGLASEWDHFVAKSKNGTFLFERAYMDYHSDRFKDHSLVMRIGEKLSGILVANEKDGRIESHGGLTYGGLILKTEVRLTDVIQMFKAFTEYYHRLGFEKIIYKLVPSYLHSFPANEDQFVLFSLGANLVRRDTSSVIVNAQRLPYMHGRSRSISEAREKKFTITQDRDCTRFWNQVLVPNLRDRYDAGPVHTSNEMDLLMNRFPENIRLYEVHRSELLAGAIIYVYPDCAHTQYLSATQSGRQQGALDLLIDHLIEEFSDKKHFSFGTSNNEGGPSINPGLLGWKEGFGARTFVHDFYEIEAGRFNVLDRYE